MALGIRGKTPGGTQWRQKAKTHKYNTRASAKAAAEEAKPTGADENSHPNKPLTPGVVVKATFKM